MRCIRDSDYVEILTNFVQKLTQQVTQRVRQRVTDKFV